MAAAQSICFVSRFAVETNTLYFCERAFSLLTVSTAQQSAPLLLNFPDIILNNLHHRCSGAGQWL